MCETCKKADSVRRLAQDVSEGRFDAGDGSVIAELLREYAAVLDELVDISVERDLND